jgi:hypothetical protein
MKKLATILLFAVCALPAAAASQSFKDVAVVDSNCHTKVASNPDAHTKMCALQCAASGYGIITSDGKYLKFDEKGNKEVLSELKASDKKDHLRVDVTGDVDGDTLKVSSVKLI